MSHSWRNIHSCVYVLFSLGRNATVFGWNLLHPVYRVVSDGSAQVKRQRLDFINAQFMSSSKLLLTCFHRS